MGKDKSESGSGGQADFDWDEFRSKVDQAIDRASAERDRTVLTIASGILGVSTALLGQISKDPSVLTAVEVAWGLFAASLITNVASMQTSEDSLRRTLRLIDSDRSRIDPSNPGGWLATATKWLNRCATWALIAGVLSLLIFVFANVGR